MPANLLISYIHIIIKKKRGRFAGYKDVSTNCYFQILVFYRFQILLVSLEFFWPLLNSFEINMIMFLELIFLPPKSGKNTFYEISTREEQAQQQKQQNRFSDRSISLLALKKNQFLKGSLDSNLLSQP